MDVHAAVPFRYVTARSAALRPNRRVHHDRPLGSGHPRGRGISDKGSKSKTATSGDATNYCGIIDRISMVAQPVTLDFAFVQ